MAQTIFFILFGFIACNTQWHTLMRYLSSNQIFNVSTAIDGYIQSGNFTEPSSTTQAQFITCTTPSTSYITLNSTKPSAQYYFNTKFEDGSFINFDLFFQGTWSNQSVIFTIGDTFQYTYSYTSPATQIITKGFCDNLIGDVKSINFTLTNTVQDKFQFTSTGSGDTQVSIKNIIISRHILSCYPSCSQCTGSNFNQCLKCYHGSVINNICPPCPQNQYYTKYLGCQQTCDIVSPIQFNGFCQSYPSKYFSIYKFQVSIIASVQFSSSNPLDPENLKWSLIYDSLNIDTSPQPFQNFYGIFKFNSGIYRYFHQLSAYSFSTYLIGLKISIILFNEIPLNCGIQFKINNTYFGSIYKNSSGIQTHKLKIYKADQKNSYINNSVTQKYDLIQYLDIPKSPIIFSAVGNYTDNSAGWGIVQFNLLQDIVFKIVYYAKYHLTVRLVQVDIFYIGMVGAFLIVKTHIRNQLVNIVKIMMIKHLVYIYFRYLDSKYLIQEYTSQANDPDQYQKYTLIFQNGSNFLKGSDIYYSQWQYYRVFGGPFVWAQAKFQRIHNIIEPHHSITIAFYIVYGPQFQSDGRFIYTIENNEPVSKSSASYFNSYPDGSKFDKVYEQIEHYKNSLTIYWECFGQNNEPVYAYCGFYNYYIVVHYCQPYCLECLDWNTCQQWNSTYDSNIVRFSQKDCLTTQYFDRDSLKCLNCPLSCQTCTSKIDCQTCQPTYIQTKLGCICKINQYEDENQCFDCPIECNQCLSSTYCIECLSGNYREFKNGQCNCIDGYYPIVSNPQCQLCHKFCKICSGPTSNDCLTCNDIFNIEKIGSICRCPTGSYYQDAIKACSPCHSSCLTCFRRTIDGCLTCDHNLNRILKELKCTCVPGYYELSNICTNCPNMEDVSLIQCYKQCNDNQQIWHTRTCNFCDLGYQLVSGECQPICGDLQIKSYEQCEDNNTNFDDLCYNCQFQCPNHCQICDQSTTLPCPDVCGDGIITGVEECEDGNTIQYDGCFNCKYQCQPSCTKCIKGQCFECVTGGWYLDITVTPWQCKEKCGDELIVGNEQCEDGNLIDTDGCKDCKYFCRTGFFLAFTFTSYQCKNVCGDGLVVTDPNGFFSEECDDGNTKNDDGCSSSCQFQCQSSTICTSCLEDRCDICATGYNLSSDKICNPICEDAKIVLGEQCETSFILPYKGCINCKVKCQGSCNQCDTTGLGCLQCQKGYNRIDYLCYSVCGDQIVTNDEDCDDGNLIIGDGCHFCQFSCQDSCLNCIQGVCFDCQEGYEFDKIQQKCNLKEVPLSFCQFQLKLSPYLHCHYCFENCETCNENNCIRCQSGYYLDNNFTCISSCGDGIVAENEECEIINSINGYECQNCQIQCQSECINCIKGICFTCEEIGWEIDLVSRECKPICGDGLVVGKEQCDDRNEIDWDGCSQCQYLCQQQCTKCFQEFCLECNFEGWYLYEKRCITNCGDGVIAGNEQCDDQNTIPFDGCYDCQLECQVQCTDCRQGVCYECAIQGWEIKNQSCQPICGDGIVIKDLEECDDGNIILFDGCYECQFECSNGCLKCQQKQCVKCLDNLYQLDAESQQCVQVNLNLNNQDIDLMNQNIIHYQNLRCGKNKQLIDNICVSLCGNGLIENEECDDGNFIGGDGCSSFCHVEDSYQCINENGTYSVCTFILAPEFNLNILSDISNSTQIVELTFSQQVKVLAELPIEEIIQFVITPETKHELILRAFQNITINLKNPKYQVLIEFHEPVSNPVLQVYANKNIIINQFDLSLDINEKYINLGTPYVLPQSTRQSLTSIIQFNGAMMYSMASISSLALITGNTIIFFNLLDLLQSLSYLKFMLYQFPPHLRNFLNTYTKVSLQPIFDYIGVDSYLIKLQGMSTSNQVNQIRNQDPQNILNQNYIFNAKGCYFSVIASILTYIIYCILISQRVERLIIKLSNKYQNNLKMIQIIRLFQKKVQKKCLISKIEYLSVGVFRVYYAILHQFMFSVSLQFPNYKFDTSFEIFNSVNAICGLLFIVIANIQLLSITSSKIKNESKWKYFYQESKTHFWALQLKSFQIYRILFYILIIVKLIDYPEAQSILLSIQSFLFLTYLIKFKPQKCVFEMVKLICREFLLIIIIGSFLIYSFEFSQESLILIGWIHIGLFCTILAINLFLDVLQQIWKTYDNYCQKKIKKEKNEQMKK